MGGLSVTSVSHYPEKTESQDRLVCQAAEMERKETVERSREVRDGERRDLTDGTQSKIKRRAPSRPSPSVKDEAVEPIPSNSKAQQEPVGTGEEPAENDSACAQVTEGRSPSVARPSSLSSPTVGSAAAPTTRASQTMDGSPAAGERDL